MYSQRQVARRLEAVEKEFNFFPQYHSRDEIDDFERQLKRNKKYQYSKDGLPIALQNITANDKQWILNEQCLVMSDAAYAITRYGWLIDEEGNVCRFNFRVAQRVLFDIISDLEDRDAAIEIMALKARQLGITSLVELLILFRLIFGRGINAVVASADRQKSRLMAKKLFMAYDMLPIWLRPWYSSRSESDSGYMEFAATNCGVSIQHGNQLSGIARGATPVVYHLCLAAHSLVRVSDSRVKPIKEITVGEHTISLCGQITTVTAVTKSPRQRELTREICVWGTPTPLSCTRDHKVLTESGWKEAKDLTNSDWLIYPIRPITQTGHIVMDDVPKWQHKKKGVKTYQPTFELGRLVGFYLAEGCASLFIATNLRTREWIRAVFGADATDRVSQRRKLSKTAIESLGHRGFAEWLIKTVGSKDEKRIPDVFWSLGKEFCKGVLYGYLAGDGHFAPESTEIYATSVRVAIPLGLRELIASLGYGWSQISYRPEGVWYNRNCRQTWILTIAGETAARLRDEFELSVIEQKRCQPSLHWKKMVSDHFAIQVESVGDGFSEDFYDIEVADDHHAFLTPLGLVHNSEVASFSDAPAQIDASIFKAVHASPSVFGILESTGEGDVGWWPDKWRYSKANWPHCRLFPLFLPWFIGKDLYPKPAWLRMRPVPEAWFEHQLPDTKEHVAKAELYVASHPEIKKHLSPDKPWTMPIEQQWYWEVNHEEAKNTEGGEATWYQEMAGDDIEALQRSSESVFGHDAIQVLSNNRRPYEMYGICGQSIEDVHEPPTDDIDYSKERKVVTYRSGGGQSFRWELIPLKHDEEYVEKELSSNPDAFWDYGQGKLQIYHHPEPGIEYSVGVDTSNGIGQDATVICVTGKGKNQAPDFQAAEFRSAYVSHVEAFAFATPIAAYYAKYMPESTPYREPIVGIEQIQAVGDTCQLQMRRSFGYSRFPPFIRLDSKKLRPGKSNKIGWYTNVWSRPILLDGFVHNVQNGWYELNSPWTIFECAHFEVHYTAAGKEKKEHEEGGHDDGIFAAAISITNIRLLEPMAERSTKRFSGEDKLKRPLLDCTPYSGRKISTLPQKELSLYDLF